MILRILIADDHPVFRRGIKQIIGETPDMIVADEVSNGWEVLDKVRSANYDVLLLDISMPGKSGIDVLIQMKDEGIALRTLVLSMHPEDQYAIRALKAGASGYLTKESAPEELVAAIRKVTAGGRYVSSSLAERLAAIVQGNTDEVPHEALSDREYQVMVLIAAGKTIEAIARELSLSAKTISTYRARILEKMRMKNNSELMRYAIDNRLIE